MCPVVVVTTILHSLRDLIRSIELDNYNKIKIFKFEMSIYGSWKIFQLDLNLILLRDGKFPQTLSQVSLICRFTGGESEDLFISYF